MGIIVGILIGLPVGFFRSVNSGLDSGLTFCLIAGFWYGGFDVLQHGLIRLLLWWRGDAPLNYARFLDYAATELHFLQKVGGGYIFVHRYLLEHFATMAERPYAEQPFGRLENTLSKHVQVNSNLNELALQRNHQSFNGPRIIDSIQVNLSSGDKLTKGGSNVPPDLPPVYGQGSRWAILVGINHYVDPNYPKLTSPASDVQAIYTQLLKGGFAQERIHLLADDIGTEPTRENILATLKHVADATEPDDLLLFYYSGHGDVAQGKSYLVTRSSYQMILSDSAIAVSRLNALMETAKARAKVIILDACHASAALGQKGETAMSAAFIKRVFEEAEGLAILSACEQGQISWETAELKGGVFTHYLGQALAGAADWDGKGFVTVQDVSRFVVDGVKLWASHNQRSQTPTLHYMLAGDIILTRQQPVAGEKP